MTKRQSVRKEDPIEEIKELYAEIKQQEKNFKKVLEVSCKYHLSNSEIIFLRLFMLIPIMLNNIVFMIEKNKDLFNDNDIVSKEFEVLVRNN